MKTTTTFRPPVLRVNVDGLVVDNFAGGGGASEGLAWAIGRDPDIAVNHDPEALAMHAANHPKTRHLCESVWDVDPRKVCAGRPVALAWFSPDCCYFSKSRGGKPFRDRNKARRRRGLAWVVVRWAKAVKPRVILLENVEEIEDWGPLDVDGRPDPARRGTTFRRWIAQIRNAGYQVEFRQLRGCDYGAPTIRKRLFVIARSDGKPIVWPAPSHGPGRAAPHRTAAECINFALPCPSIFERKKPLAEATLRRIARGIMRYVVHAAKPFIVPVTHHGDARVHSIYEPMRTITGAHRGEFALIAPYLSPVTTHGGGGNEPRSVEEPMRTITTSKRGETAVVTPFLARIGQTGGNGKYTNAVDEPVTTVTTKAEHLLIAPTLVRTAHGDVDKKGKKRGRGEHDIQLPLPTITASTDFALVAPTLIQTGRGERKGQAPRCLDIEKPLGTVQAEGVKHAVVAAFLARHYGGHENDGAPMEKPIPTITTVDHHALVASHIVKLRGTCRDGQPVTEPLATITGGGTHLAEVRAFLIKYYGAAAGQDQAINEPLHTVTAKPRFGLVTVMIAGEEYAIVDIGMRMLTPRELFNAQGFGPEYVIDPVVDKKRGKKTFRGPLSKEGQVRMCGNSVNPPLAAALALANVSDADVSTAAA